MYSRGHFSGYIRPRARRSCGAGAWAQQAAAWRRWSPALMPPSAPLALPQPAAGGWHGQRSTQTLGGLLLRQGGFGSGLSVYTPSRNSIKSSITKRKSQRWEPGSRAVVTAADSAERDLQRRKAPQLGHSHSKPGRGPSLRPEEDNCQGSEILHVTSKRSSRVEQPFVKQLPSPPGSQVNSSVSLLETPVLSATAHPESYCAVGVCSLRGILASCSVPGTQWVASESF